MPSNCGSFVLDRSSTSMRNLFLLILTTLISLPQLPLKGQNVSIGEWRVHTPYGNPREILQAGDLFYISNSLAVYSYDTRDGAIQRFSKVNLLSDIGVRSIFLQEEREALVIAYSNSNIDVLEEGQIFNFPFIRNQNIVGDKTVYDVTFFGDTAYFACGFGVVVFDLERLESPATYFFQTPEGTPIRVNATAVRDGQLYAATEHGLYRADLSNPLLEEFAAWDHIDAGVDDTIIVNIQDVYSWSNVLHIKHEGELYEFDGSDWILWNDGDDYQNARISVQGDTLFLTQTIGDPFAPDSSRILMFDRDGLITTLEESFLPVPMSTLWKDGSFWTADLFRGLIRYTAGNIEETINPDGPATSKVFSMASNGSSIFVAPGEVNGSWNKLFNIDGFFEFNSFDWINYNSYNTPLLDSVFDVLTVTADPSTGKTWLGTFGSGLIEIAPDGTVVAFKQGTGISPAVGDESNYRVAGVAQDNLGNIWLANHGAARPIVLRTPSGQWANFQSGLPSSAGEGIAQCVADDFGHIWYVVVRGNGLLVYDPGQDLESELDDQTRQMGLGAGNGNLHTVEVLSIAKDLDGEIWIGTKEGITVFYNPGAAFENGSTLGDAAQIFVQQGEFGAFLLEEEFVNCIAIDGANRKWIGTDNGAFLVSEDGTDQLLHFTTGNSPLLNNSVNAIAIAEQTGEVFFGTDDGIISYRGEATGGAVTHSDVRVFPNPVRKDYNGPIAIKGLVTDADVKITDAAGRLVYETTALGGQAVWNGRLIDTKERAATGVYLVFSSDANGADKFVTKFLMVR